MLLKKDTRYINQKLIKAYIFLTSTFMNSYEVREILEATNDVSCLGMFINIDQSAGGCSSATEWMNNCISNFTRRTCWCTVDIHCRHCILQEWERKYVYSHLFSAVSSETVFIFTSTLLQERHMIRPTQSRAPNNKNHCNISIVSNGDFAQIS